MSDGHLNFDTKIDEKGFNEGIGKLGNLAKSSVSVIGKAMVGATAAVTAAGVAMTKASLDVVASMEQNIGGVQTLFKDSADKVIENANRAFETAGMSANEYMSTVTSFSASLLQSLGGDTEKAADVADMAITDMSDNANKMGTSMELIQNAYQGFAKQNYTMLDNLKLGYGGTKTEMERLLADAEKISGVKYDISNLNDVYQAIHVIQDELGITGTTAKEASSTIEGSMNAAKAAWENFLGGTASADQFADALSVAAGNIIKNLGEIVPRLIATVPEVVKAIYKQFSESLEERSAGLIEKGIEMIGNIISGLTASAPKITQKAGDIVSNFISNIQKNAPSMITAAADMIASFVQGIGAQLPELVPKALQMLVTVADGIISNLPTIVNAGIALLKGLAQGIVNSLPTLIAEVPRIINDFADAIYSGLAELLKAGWEMIKSLAQGIWENRGLILENAGEIFMAILNVFSLSKLFSLGKGIITNLAKGAKSLASHPVTTLKEIAKNAMNALKNLSWKDIGKNIISGIVTGIKNSAGALVSGLVDAGGKALKGIKDLFDINSPSRVFRDEVGKMMALGMGIGFEKNIPIKSMNTKLRKAVNSLKGDVAITTSANTRNTVGSFSNNPLFTPNNSFDFDEYERRQRKLNKERDGRPIFLGTDRIDRPLPKGAVPAIC